MVDHARGPFRHSFSGSVRLAGTDASRGIAYHARCDLVIAAKACGVAAIDCVYLSVKDEAGFREDARLGASLGYEGKLCIHPRQVEIANAVYTPEPAAIDYARRVVEASEQAKKEGRGVFSLDGKMIDEPVVASHRRILQRARTAVQKSRNVLSRLEALVPAAVVTATLAGPNPEGDVATR